MNASLRRSHSGAYRGSLQSKHCSIIRKSSQSWSLWTISMSRYNQCHYSILWMCPTMSIWWIRNRNNYLRRHYTKLRDGHYRLWRYSSRKPNWSNCPMIRLNEYSNSSVPKCRRHCQHSWVIISRNSINTSLNIFQHKSISLIHPQL